MLLEAILLTAFAAIVPTVHSASDLSANSFFARGVQDEATKESLYNRWHDNYRTDQKVAYDAAREYLKRFPYDTSDKANFMRKWMEAYERVVANNTVGTATPRNVLAPTVSAPERFRLGTTHLKVHEWREAEEEFKAALVLDPPNTEYRRALADALGQQEKWSEAEIQYRLLVDGARDSYEFRQALADALFHLERWADAEIEYRKVLLLKPDAGDAVALALAKSLGKQGKFAEAQIMLGPLMRSIGKRDTTHQVEAELWALEGTFLAGEGKTEEAQTSFIYAVVKDHNNRSHQQLLENVVARTKGVPVDLTKNYWHQSDALIQFSTQGDVLFGVNKYREYSEYRVDQDKGKWKQVGNVVYVESSSICKGEWCVGIIDKNKISFTNAWYLYDYPSTPHFVEKVDPDGESYVGSYAKILLTWGKADQAEIFYRKVLQSAATHPSRADNRIYTGLALALAAQGKWAEAEQAMSVVVDRDHTIFRDQYKSALKDIRAHRKPELYEGRY